MVYFLEQNIFIITSYYRNGVLQNGEWTYSVSACKNDYIAKFPEENVSETALIQHIRNVVNRFLSTGNVNKGKSSGRLPVSDEVVQDVRNRLEQSPNKSLSKLSLQADVPRSTCHKIDKKVLHFHPYRVSSVQAKDRSNVSGKI